MSKLKTLANRYFFTDDLPFESRILNFVCFFGALAAFFALVSRLIAGMPFITIVPILLFLATILSMLSISLRRTEPAAVLMIVIVNGLSIVFWPFLFYTIGGPGSGMAVYWAFAIILDCTLLKGKTRIITILITSAATVFCYVSTLFLGWGVLPEGGLSSFELFIDIMQSIFIVGILMGLIIIFHIKSYQDESSKAEAAFNELKNAQRTVTAIFESNPHMNVMFDSNFQPVECNPAAIKFMGFENREEMLAGFADRMSESIPEFQSSGRPSRSMKEVLTEAVKAGYLRFETELVLLGKPKIIDMEFQQISYGDSYALLGYMMDMTDIHEKEDVLALRTSELESAINAVETAQHTVSAMFESNPHMNIMMDSNFNVIDCNPASMKFLGFETKDEMFAGFTERILKCIPEYQPGGRPSISMSERLNTAAKDGYLKFETEFVINEQIVIVDIEMRRIPYGDSFALVIYLTDLTAIREWERELVNRDGLLQKAIDEAQAANEAKSAFLANMSHEIRTPMNSIMGFAELALDKVISPQVKDYLSKITDNTQWLLQIINDILDISKIESGKMELENVPFDLHSIFSRCQSVIHPSVTEKGLDLHIYSEPLTGKRLIGDPVRLYQALMNLLSNAVKFTSTGTVRMSSAITGADDNTVKVCFEVKDSGIGMTAAQIEKIFEPFMQADSSTTRNYGGTGLGLPIVNNLVELMGGKLDVESSPGLGSIFSFELLFETIDAAEDAPEYAEMSTVEKPEFRGLVLICEDNPMNQQVICENLALVGLQTVVAENGKAGVEMVGERLDKGQPPFDMIFMDIFMPVMDGIEAASRITALGTQTPIVAMTANVMIRELDNYKKSGMHDCVGKPFTTQELWRCLLRHLTPLSLSVVDESGQMRDDNELQMKLQKKFVRDNQTKYGEITEAIAAGDIALAHRLAHTLKGNAGQIGKTALQSAAADVEAQLEDGTVPAGSESLDLLESELCSVLDDLKPLLDESAEQSGSENKSAEQIRALFKRLEQMLENINPECLDLLDDIRAVPGAEELARQIEDIDFESAAGTLSEIMKDWV